MKAKKFIAPALLGVFIFSSIISIGITAPQKQQEKDKKQAAKAEERIFIPKEIKVILQEGMATRQGRQNIPFTIFRHLYLPAQQNALYNIFFLKIQNADLSFSPMMPAAKAEKGKEKEKAEAAPPAEPQASQQLQARLNLFLQFNLLQENQPPQSLKEVYVPVGLQEEVSTYDANKEEVYTFGYPLPAGKYLLAMAVTTPDLKKIGTQYFEFALPNMSSASQPDTTSIFFVKKIDQMESLETRTSLHKNFFTYSILKIEPNIDNTFAPGDNLDIFFYIYGAQPVEEAQATQPRYKLEINYEVKKIKDENELTKGIGPLLLLNWKWAFTETGSYVETVGEVKNISGASLKDVEAVVTYYDKDGNYINHSSALVEYNPILQGQSTPFKIIEKSNPAIKSAKVEFKYLNGEKINTDEKEELAIRWATQTYDAPLISQPLPLKQTMVIKKGDQETKEIRDLQPGKYTLLVKVTDKVSGSNLTKTVDFEVK